jgi:hypothetical protein
MGKYKGVTCFFLTPIARVRLRLRRYSFKDNRPCVNGHDYHNAEATLYDEDQPLDKNRTHGDLHPHDDPAWPKSCDRCDYEFVDEDHWQLNPDRLYESSADHKPMTIHEAPPGAMWYADWYSENFKGPDGRCLVVRCPNGHDWIIDSQASNCTKPDDKEHNCWYREGTPPNITIVHPHPKSCRAGAGSIGIGSPDKGDYYHGFLRGGKLTDG